MPMVFGLEARVVVAAGLADSTIVLWRASSAPHDRRAFEADESSFSVFAFCFGLSVYSSLLSLACLIVPRF